MPEFQADRSRSHRADCDLLAEGVVWHDAEGRIVDATRLPRRRWA